MNPIDINDPFILTLINEYGMSIETEQDRKDLILTTINYEFSYLIGHIQYIILKHNYELDTNRNLSIDEMKEMINSKKHNFKYLFKPLDTNSTTKENSEIYKTVNLIKKLEELTPSHMLIEELYIIANKLDVNNWRALAQSIKDCRNNVNLYLKLKEAGMDEHIKRITDNLDERLKNKKEQEQEIDEITRIITIRRIEEIGLENVLKEMEDEESDLMKEINKVTKEKAKEYINKKNGE